MMEDEQDKRVISIFTEPKVSSYRAVNGALADLVKVGIGQRAILIETAQGNVLWDLITFLDDDTIEFVSNSNAS